VNDPLVGQQIIPPPSAEVNTEEEYQVSKIENGRIYQNELEYLIRRTGYDSLSWEPAKFVNCIQAVKECHKRYRMKLGLSEVFWTPQTKGGDNVTVPLTK